MPLPTLKHNTNKEIIDAYDELAAAMAGGHVLDAVEYAWMTLVEIQTPELLEE